MSYLFNDPAAFADEVVEGFVAANAALVRPVTGGVIRASATPSGEVAVVIGGGSGHYPAFAGLVGQGLAHGAAMGNLFASPSAHQVHSVARAAAGDAGVLLTYGNYAGDVLNFDQAEARLNAEGIPCRTVVVTDDVSSAAADERHKRRGIAGDLVVFRVAAWAAEQGRTLDEIAEVAGRANDRTRSLGVAFSGCTLPGADAPLFTVPEGRMAVGLGIHGEPGIDEVDVPTAAGLAELLVGRLLDEVPEGVGEVSGARVALILNGLGSVKYEELFVTYRTVAALLAEAGVEVVQPDVGELVTSFEMAGVSLTLLWLDDELETAWGSPAYGAAYRKGAVVPLAPSAGAADVDEDETAVPDASDASRQAAGRALAALRAVHDVVDEHVDELGRLDAIAGDGDHGIGMLRGSTAALTAAETAAAAGAGAGTVLARAGDAWADRAGGTSGALWGLALREVGEALGDERAPSGPDLAAGVRAALDAIAHSGGATLGDKTMIDALDPFSAALGAHIREGEHTADAWRAAATEAVAAADRTADLTPKLGRARPHAEKSIGTPDPGAVSLGMAVTAIGAVLAAPLPAV